MRLLSRKKTETQARLQAVRDESITCFLAQICIFYTHKLQCENGIDLSLSLPPVHVWVSENRSRKFKHFPPRGAERWRGPGEGGASLFQGRHLFLQRKNLSKLRCANFQTGQVNIASHSDESLNRCVFLSLSPLLLIGPLKDGGGRQGPSFTLGNFPPSCKLSSATQ